MKGLMSVLMLSLLSLAPNQASAQSADLETPSVDVAVGGRALLGYLPLTIADRNGFFSEEGLTVNISDFAGGSKSLQALVGGSADIVSGAYEHTILSAVRGIELKAIALQNNSFGVVIALPTDEAASYTSPEDLQGKAIGVTAPGSSSAVAVSVLLAKDGLTAEDVSIVGVGGGAGARSEEHTSELQSIMR